MDIPQLAAEVAKFLAPFLPYLILGTEAAAKEAGKRFGGAMWDKAVELWGKLKPKVEEKPAAQEAVEDVAKNQGDEDAHAAFRRQLTKLFEADKELFNFIAERITIENVIITGGNVENSIQIAGKNNTVIKVDTYIHGNIYNGPAPRSPQDALKVYRAVMANMTSSLSMRGIDLRASDPNTQRAIDLANIYVDLDTTTPLIVVDKSRKIHRTIQAYPVTDSKLLPVLEAIIQYKSLVIKGDPGSGKSTFVNYLTHCLSTHATERLADWNKEDADLLPVIVILRDFVKSFKKLPEQAVPRHLWDFIEKRLKNQNLSSASKPIQELLEQGKVILFLDGLDEVATIPQRVFVRDAVHAFSSRYAKNHFVVTCRVLSYTEAKGGEPDLRLAGFPEVELAPFDDEKIKNFIDAWYRELTTLGVVTPEMADDLNAGLKTAVRRPELRRLAPNPLLLTVMAVVNTHKGRLPNARALLYKETVEILLWQWEQASKGQDAARMRQLLLEADCSDTDLEQVIWELAYEAHAQTDLNNDDEETLAGISELGLQKALAVLNKGNLNWAASVIETMKLRAGLLLERDNNVFTFPHRSFQEFLAGTYLESKDDFVSRAKKLADDQLLWRQAILWAVSRRVYIRGSLDGPLALIAELCPSRPLENEKEWSRVWLAGDILLEIGLSRVERTELGTELLLRVRNRLVELLEGSHLTPRERSEAGSTLAKLGDIRFDDLRWQLSKESLFGFVYIPASEFWIGTQEDDIAPLIETFGGKEEYYRLETPCHKLYLNEYYIARYPVTVAQFNEFVKDSKYEPSSENSLLGILNHPVRNITWYDALAYCKWLNEKLKTISAVHMPNNEIEDKFWSGINLGTLVVKLPSEAEWEKGARGDGDTKIFPWGDDESSNKANCNMTIGSTSSVGCFPQGKSPYGLLDMSGNVWEWTRSIHKAYTYDPFDGRENLEDRVIHRVLRGGGFYDGNRDIRCACRYWYFPDLWVDRLGFRVVVGINRLTE